MKKIVFIVHCCPIFDIVSSKENLKISIQRTNHDTSIDMVRHYLKKLVFLTNKMHMPTLFMAVDLHNFQSSDVWHCLYKLNKDREVPYLALRIIRLRSDFFQQIIKI